MCFSNTDQQVNNSIGTKSWIVKLTHKAFENQVLSFSGGCPQKAYNCEL